MLKKCILMHYAAIYGKPTHAIVKFFLGAGTTASLYDLKKRTRLSNCSLSSPCYIHSPATTSLDRAASSQVSPGLSCHKRASPPAHHLCQPWHRGQHLPPLKCRILILFDLFRSHWKLRDFKCRKKWECIQGSDHNPSIMDCTQFTILNNFWFSLSHPGLMLPLQITMLLLHVHDCLKTTG